MDIPSATDDFAQRRLCPDGSCTGIIGPDGRCTVCGRLVETPEPAPQGAGEAPANEPRGLAETAHDDPAPQSAQSTKQTAGPDQRKPGQAEGDEEDEFESRRLCPDGSCTGIIGPDGRCTECGRLAED